MKIMLSAVVLVMLTALTVSARKPKTVVTNAPPAAAAAQVESDQQKQAVPAENVAANTGAAILVKVDDLVITQADLDGEIAQIKQMMKSRGGSPQQFEALLKNIKPQILEGLIVRKLIARECEREKIAVTPEDTAKEIEIFKASLPKKISLDDFLKQNGISKETFERDVGEQVKIEKLLKVANPTDAEIKAYYDANKSMYYELPETVSARHILITVDAADDAAKKNAKKKKAEDLRKQLVKGADFAKLAEENSDCPSKAKGGKLDDFSRGRMVPAFEEAAFSLKANEISGVVETEFGYHIIQTLALNPPRTLPLEEVKGQIAFRLKNKKMQEQLEALVKKLKSSAKIEYQKAAEDLKMTAPDESSFPVMPADEKKPVKEKSAEEKSDKSGK